MKRIGKMSAIVAVVGLAGCGLVEDIKSAIDEATSQIEEIQNLVADGAAYPSKLSIASPFSSVEEEATSFSLKPTPQQMNQPPAPGDGPPRNPGDGPLPPAPGGREREQEFFVAQIDALLATTDPTQCRFDPRLMLRLHDDARCYGPEVAYINHPDGPDQTPARLPKGDTGMWMVTDPVDGQACGASQLTARMNSLRNQTFGALMGLASLICAAQSHGRPITLPVEQNLLRELGQTKNPGTQIARATLEFEPSAKAYLYALSLTVTPEGGGPEAAIAINMRHQPGADAGEYTGLIQYAIVGPKPFGGCPGNRITHNGSIEYSRSGEDFVTDVRRAVLCGENARGFGDDGLVDPANVYDPADNAEGWQTDFNWLRAAFSRATLAGDYALSWQAGGNDTHSRVFNLHLDGEETVSGHAFYGFGAPVQELDGNIQGMICNWAGPGNSHEIRPFVQHQELVENADTGVIDAAVSELRYAPTNTCDYAGGPFKFDRNGDGSFADDPTGAVDLGLLPVDDANNDGVLDEIAETGFSQP